MAENPFNAPSASTIEDNEGVLTDSMQSSSSVSLKWFAIAVSVASWFLAYLAGVDAATGQNPALFTLLFSAVSSTWVYYDAKRRRLRLASAVHFLVFFACVIAVPVYLVYTRKRVGLFWIASQIACVCGAWYSAWRFS